MYILFFRNFGDLKTFRCENEMFFRKSFRFNLQQKHTQNHRNVKANIKTKQRKRKNVPIRNIYSVQMQSYTKEFRGKRFFCKL